MDTVTLSASEPHTTAAGVPKTAGKPHSGAPQFVARRIVAAGELVDLRDAWHQLAAESSDPNPFYEPWYFLPAVTHFATSQRWQVVLVERVQADGQRTLSGFFPFMESRTRLGLRCWTLWKHPLVFLTSPLVQRGEETEVWNSVWTFLKDCDRSPMWAGFPMMGEAGGLQTGFVESIRDQLSTIFHVDRFPRAMITFPEDPQQYLKQTVDGHHLRELRRLRRKLEQSGQLEYRSLQDPACANLWSEWFLTLEANGWKAAHGTALKQSESHSQFFREIVRAGCENGQLKLEGLFLNGEPIALKCNLHRRPATFAFKIAYREDLRKYSPGIQLEIESLERYSGDPSITWSDSCAIPRHSMIERLWTERRIVQNVLVSTGTSRSEMCLSSLPLARALKRMGQRISTQLTGCFSKTQSRS